jgi:hypothetical protein
LYDLLQYASHFDAAVPNTSFRLQLYIDSFLPLAFKLVRNEPLIESEFKPFLCYEETILANTMNIMKAFVYSDLSETTRRNQKRQKSAWEVFRRVLSRGIHSSSSSINGFDYGKPKTFKTMAAEFTDVFMHENDCTIHEVVLCSLLGNYACITDRPPWATRLLVYSLYTRRETTWLNKCDYVTYFAIRELLSNVVEHIYVLKTVIESDESIHEYWLSMQQNTRETLERMRSSLYDISETKGLKDVNEFLKSRYSRNAKLSAQSFSEHEIPLAQALLSSTQYQKAHTYWLDEKCSRVVSHMLKHRLTISFQILETFVSEDCASAFNTTLVHIDKVDEFMKQCDEHDANCIRDIAKGIFIQSSIRLFRLPDAYFLQLTKSMQNDQMRITYENMQRNSCMYVCTNCFDIMNNVLTLATIGKQKLKYAKGIRIDIQMDGSIVRYCEECCKKRPRSTLPLLEIPLLTDEKHAMGVNMLGSALMMCPKCCLLVKKNDIRFQSHDEWCCVLCSVT